MVDPEIEHELLVQLNRLRAEQQRQVLDFARALATVTPRGVAGRELLPFAGSIAEDDLRVMAEAIERDCEQVNPDEW